MVLSNKGRFRYYVRYEIVGIPENRFIVKSQDVPSLLFFFCPSHLELQTRKMNVHPKNLSYLVIHEDLQDFDSIILLLWPTVDGWTYQDSDLMLASSTVELGVASIGTDLVRCWPLLLLLLLG